MSYSLFYFCNLTFKDETTQSYSSRYLLNNGNLQLNEDKYDTMNKEEYSTSWGESHHE
ncbi:hypothetical protein ACQKMV_18560 [Lysinibacillus sp. NPDC094403]|uniref:hypothetical protein n=1 Tax=Lysinibacillus sp. NPDC094403 TaxID=3390581 RepID=UPI003D0070AF